jgi:mannose-6-phosphate isomerase-like protein (cupin superfamily)
MARPCIYFSRRPLAAALPLLLAGMTLLALTLAAPLAAQSPGRTVPPPLAITDPGVDARTILQRYVDAWRGPEEMVLADTTVMGFRFRGEGGGEYHAVLSPDGRAVLGEGIPAGTVILHGEMDILRRLDRGELSALTAMGRAHIRERTPLDFELPPGMGYADVHARIPIVFHFFNRDWPEVIRFGEGTTRFVHGGHSAILYYGGGVRTAFYQVRPGTHINEPESEQVNPFPSLFIVIRGAFESRLGGVQRTLSEGEAVLVPAGMTHEFWAGAEQYGEFIMVAFGEGA